MRGFLLFDAIVLLVAVIVTLAQWHRRREKSGRRIIIATWSLAVLTAVLSVVLEFTAIGLFALFLYHQLVHFLTPLHVPPILVKAIACLLVLPVLLGIILTFSWDRSKRYVGIGILSVIAAGVFGGTYLLEDWWVPVENPTRFFNDQGKPLLWYCDRGEEGLYFARREMHDPLTGEKCKPVTSEVAKRYRDSQKPPEPMPEGKSDPCEPRIIRQAVPKPSTRINRLPFVEDYRDGEYARLNTIGKWTLDRCAPNRRCLCGTGTGPWSIQLYPDSLDVRHNVLEFDAKGEGLQVEVAYHLDDLKGYEGGRQVRLTHNWRDNGEHRSCVGDKCQKPVELASEWHHFEVTMDSSLRSKGRDQYTKQEKRHRYERWCKQWGVVKRVAKWLFSDEERCYQKKIHYREPVEVPGDWIAKLRIDTKLTAALLDARRSKRLVRGTGLREEAKGETREEVRSKAQSELEVRFVSVALRQPFNNELCLGEVRLVPSGSEAKTAEAR